ncbi:lipoprotein 17-related variable surface protein [Mycoplasmopsis columboralis]|uniref:ECM-binding protein homolog n=1 Tax=Mycoplasmopsis columboralis TaxID=171282 RepID=A0A449B667_9BACT|nr:lipoprotein 17-related variable surface protein [Mycoplasmopsis columboralis]VEU76055.1 ECM-binding protein homolog [Mycoplasmopsis columboralis]
MPKTLKTKLKNKIIGSSIAGSSLLASLLSFSATPNVNDQYNEIIDATYLSPTFTSNSFQKSVYLSDETFSDPSYDYTNDKWRQYVENSADLNYSTIVEDKVSWITEFNGGATYEKNNEYRYTSNPGFGIYFSDDLELDGPIEIDIIDKANNTKSHTSFAIRELDNGQSGTAFNLWRTSDNDELNVTNIATTQNSNITSQQLYDSITSQYGMDQKGNNFVSKSTEIDLRNRVGTVLFFSYRTEKYRTAKFVVKYKTKTRANFQNRILNESRFQKDSTSFVGSAYFAKLKYSRSSLYTFNRAPIVEVSLDATNNYPDRRGYGAPGINYTLYKRKTTTSCAGAAGNANFANCFDRIYSLPTSYDSTILNTTNGTSVRRKYKLNLRYTDYLKTLNSNSNYVWVSSINTNSPSASNWKPITNDKSFTFNPQNLTFSLTNTLELKDELKQLTDEQLRKVEISADKYKKLISELQYLPEVTDNNIDLSDSKIANDIAFLKALLNNQRQELYTKIKQYLDNPEINKFKDNTDISRYWSNTQNKLNAIKDEDNTSSLIQLRDKLKQAYNAFDDLQKRISTLPLRNSISSFVRVLDASILESSNDSVSSTTPVPSYPKYRISAGLNNPSDYISKMVYNNKIISMQTILRWNNYVFRRGDGTEASLSASDQTTAINYYRSVINEWQEIRSTYQQNFENNTLTDDQLIEYSNKIRDFYNKHATGYSIPGVSTRDSVYVSGLGDYIGIRQRDGLDPISSVRPLFVYRLLNDNSLYNQMNTNIRLAWSGQSAYRSYDVILPLFGFSKQDFYEQIDNYLAEFKSVQGRIYNENKEPNVNQSILRFINAAVNAKDIDSWLKHRDLIKTSVDDLTQQRNVYINDRLNTWRLVSQIKRATASDYASVFEQTDSLINSLNEHINVAEPIVNTINSNSSLINQEATTQSTRTKTNSDTIEDILLSAPTYESLVKNEFSSVLNKPNSTLGSQLNTRISTLKQDWIDRMNQSISRVRSELPDDGSAVLDSDGIPAIRTYNGDTTYSDSKRNNIIDSWKRLRTALQNLKEQAEQRIIREFKDQSKAKIDQLLYLSRQLRDNYKQKIEAESDFSLINELVFEAQDLDEYTKIGIIPIVEEAKKTLKHVLYKSSDISLKTNYKNALTKIATLLGTTYDEQLSAGHDFPLKSDNDSNSVQSQKHHQLQLDSQAEFKKLAQFALEYSKAKSALNGAVVNINSNKDNKKQYTASSQQTTDFTAEIIKNQSPEGVENYENWTVQITSVNEQNDKTGSLNVGYKVLNAHTNTLSEERFVTINGYKTESERLDEVLRAKSGEKVIANLLTQTEKENSPSQIQKTTIEEKLNAIFASSNAKVADVSLIPKDAEGKLGITYKLISTLPNLTDVKSTLSNNDIILTDRSKDNEITGFADKEAERNRLKQIVLSFDYINKQNIVPYDNATLSADQLTISSNQNTQRIASGQNSFIFADQQFSVSSITFTNADPRNGTVNVLYTLRSLKPAYTDVTVTISEATEANKINLFLTESRRLDQAISTANNLASELFTDSGEKDKLATAVTEQNIIDELTNYFSSQSANAIDLTEVNKNVNNGTVAFKYKLISTKTNLTDVKSTNSSNLITISGFKSVESETQRLQNLQSAITSADYVTKENKVISETFSNIFSGNTTYQVRDINDEQVRNFRITISVNGVSYTSEYENGKQVFKNLGAYVKKYAFGSLTYSRDRSGELTPFGVALGTLTEEFDSQINLNVTSQSDGEGKLKITGFKTEKQRLDELVDAKQNNLAALFTDADKNVFANEVTLDQIKAKIAQLYQNDRVGVGSTASTFIDGSLTKDVENGTITFKYKINGQHFLLASIISKESNSITVSGFKTIAQEKQRLDTLGTQVSAISYSEKNFLLNYPTAQTLEPSKLTITITDENNNSHVSTWNGSELVFEDLQAKVVDLTFGAITNSNDLNGSLPVTFKLQSTNPSIVNANKTVQSDQVSKQLNGFKTEAERLNEAIPTLGITDEKVSALIANKKRDVNSITKQEILDAILSIAQNALNTKNSTVTLDNITISEQSSENGTITYEYTINSTRDLLNGQNNNPLVKSTSTGSINLSGFTNEAREQAKVNNLASSIRRITYKGSSTIVPSEGPLDYKQLEVVFVKDNVEYVAKYQEGNENKLVFENNPLDVDLTNISFTVDTTKYTDDVAGTVKVNFDVQSNIRDFSSVKTSVSNQAITGFKTELQRLNELVNSNLSSNISFSDDEKQKLPSQVNNRDILAKIQAVFNANANKSNPNFAPGSLTKDDQAGTITVTFGLTTTKSVDVSVKSTDTKTLTFTGFGTLGQEKTRLDELLNALNDSNIDYSDKAKTPLLTDFVNTNVLWKLSTESNFNTSLQNNDEQVEIEIDSFNDKNDVNGTATVRYRLHSTKPGYANIYSEYKVANLSNFQTEAQRLTVILKADNNQQESKAHLDALKAQIPSEVTKAQVKEKLNIDFNHDNSDVDLNSINLTANDNDGTLTISYKLVSTRDNLTNVLSSEARTIALTNMRSAQSEKERLNNLSTNATLNYSDKAKTPQLTEFNLANLSITINGENGVYNASEQAFVFATNKAKVKDITFKNKNDAGDATHSDNSGSVDIEYKIYSTEPAFATLNVVSDSATKTVSGFVSEQQRVNSAKTDVESAINADTLIANKNRTTSQVTDEEILNALKGQISAQTLVSASDLSVTKDADAGTITATWKVVSTREGFNESSTEPVKSIQSIKTTLTGFISKTQEQERINNLATQFTSADYAQKTNLITATDLTYEQLSTIFTVENNPISFAYSATNPNKLVTSSNVDAEITNITFAQKSNTNDRDGQIQVTFELHSTKPGFEDVKQTVTATLSGFKTETQRLNEVLNSKSRDIDALEFTQDIKDKGASQVSDAQVITLLNSALNNTDSLVKSEGIIGSITKNNEAGTITVEFKLNSARESLESVQSSQTHTVTFNGFKTNNQVKEDLNNLISNSINIDYADKANLPSTTTFAKNKFTFAPKDSTQSWMSQVSGEDVLIGEPVFAKLEEFEVTSKDDKTGSIAVRYKLRSTKAGFENVVTEFSTSTSISGFKTELQRLNEVLNGTDASSVDYAQKATVSPSTVTAQDLIEQIKALYSNSQASLVASDLTLTPNNENGSLTISYNITSTREGLTDVQSNVGKTITITGFISNSQEATRLNELLQRAQVSYKNKETLLPGKTQFTLENLEVTIDGVKGVWDSQSQSLKFDAPVSAEIKSAQFNNPNDRVGSESVTFKLYSTKPGLTTQESAQKEYSINGFKTEQQRLNELLTAKNEQINSLTYPNAQNKTASELTNELVATQLNTLFTNDEAKIQASNIVSITPNNDNGTAVVVFKVNSARTDQQLADVVSSETASKTFSGFITKEQETQRLNTLLTDILRNINYTDKATWPTATTFNNDNVTFEYNSQSMHGLAILEQANAKVSAIDFDEKNDRDGSVKIALTLTSTKPGLEDVSVSNSNTKTTVSGFKTEIDRLNALVNTTDVSTKDVNNKDQKPATSITKEEIKALFDTAYSNESAQINVEDITLTANNEEGTLKVVYKLTSTKDSLTDLKSTQTKELTLNGFKSNNTEKDRLNALLRKATITYADKTHMPSETNLDLSQVTITIDGTVGTYNPQTQSFVFEGDINAVISGVAIVETSRDDVNGTLTIQATTATSTREGFTTIQSGTGVVASSQLDGFKTEIQRLNELAAQNRGTVKVATSVDKTQKLPSEITKDNLVFETNTTDRYKIDPAKATLSANDQSGTLTITFPLTTTRDNELGQSVSSTQTVTLTINGFETAYERSKDNLDNFDNTKVVIDSNLDNKTSNLPNNDGAKNKDNYTPTITNNSDQNIVAQIIGVIGHDLVNGKTLVAYKLVDNNPDHTNPTTGAKPESKVFFKVVDGFETEAQRLEKLKDTINNAFTYSDTNKPQASTLPSVTEENSFNFNSTTLSDNQVSTQKGTKTNNDHSGEVTYNYSINTTKQPNELYSVDNSTLDATAQRDLETFKASSFASPTEQEFKVSVANTKVFNGFLNDDQDLTNKINALKDQIDQKENLSQEEKDKLKSDLDKIKDNFDATKDTDNQAHQKALEAIENVKELADSTDEAKAQEIANVDQNYPNLNKAQRDQVKDNIKNSNKLDIPNSTLPTLDEVKDEASALNTSMGVTANKANNNDTFKASPIYASASDAQKDLYEKAIQAAKDLIPTPDSSDGTNAKTPVLDGITTWQDSIDKPTNSNYSKEAVDELNRVIDEIIADMTTLKNQKDAAKAAIDALPNLSDQEKQHFKDLVDQAQSGEQVTNISQNASNINDEKTALINSVDTDPQYQHLNTSQKQALKKEIKNSNKVPGLEPQTDAVLAKGQALNNAMKSLKDAIATSNVFQQSQDFIASTDADNKDKLQRATQGAQQLVNNTNPSAQQLANLPTAVVQENANWNKEAVDKLKNDIENLILEIGGNVIDSLKYLSEDEKNNFKEQLNNATDQATQQAIINKAKEDNAAKKAIADTINNLEHLNQTQKDALIDELKNSNLNAIEGSENPTSQSVLDKANALNDKMKELKDINAKAKEVMSGDKYSDVSQPNKDKLENASNVADDIIGNKNPQADKVDAIGDLDGLNANATKEQVETLIEKLQTAIKESLKDQIDHFDNLNENEKQTLKDALDNPDTNTPEKIQEVIDRGKAINDKKQAAIDAINGKEYLSDDEKAQLIDKVKAVDFSDKTQDETNDQKIAEILNEATTKDNDKKAEVDKVLALENLNQSQKDYFKEEIKKSNLETIDGSSNPLTADVVAKATALDTSMKHLKDLAGESTEVKETPLYKSASQEDKSKYQDLIDASKELINNQNPDANKVATVDNLNAPDTPNWDKDSVDKLINAIENSLKEALKHSIDNMDNLSDDEKEKFKQAIDDATDKTTLDQAIENAQNTNDAKQREIDNVDQNYPHLNQSQKDAVKEAIKNANLSADTKPGAKTVEQVKADAQSLDDSMAKLDKLIKEQDKMHQNDIYQNASQETKDKYDNAVNAGSLLEKNTNPDVSNIDGVTPQDSANWNKDAVDSLISAIEKALKDSAKEAIDNLPNLNDAEKTTLKKQIDDLSDSSQEEINKVIDKAKELNDQKQAIIDQINNQENLSQDEKDKLIKDVKDVTLTDPQTNDQANEQLQNIKNNAEDINNQKQTEIDKINNYEHLNQDQKDHYVAEIKKSNLNNINNSTNASTAEVAKQASDLNDSMKALKDALVDVNNLDENISDHLNEDKAALLDDLNTIGKDLVKNKATEDALIDKVNKSLNNATQLDKNPSANWDKTNVDKLTQALKDSLKDAYKDAIDNLPNLNDAEKETLKNQIDALDAAHTTKEELDKILDRAKEINDKKQAAIDEINKLPHLSEEEKQSQIDKIKGVDFSNNQNDSQNNQTLEDIIDESRDKDLTKALEEYTKDHLNNNNADEAQKELNKIKDLIDSFKKYDQAHNKDTSYDKYDKLVDSLTKINDIKKAYEAYLNSDVALAEQYTQNKDALENAIEQLSNSLNTLDSTQLNNDALEKVKEDLKAQANKEINLAKAEIEIVEAIKSLPDTNDANAFNQAIADALAKMQAAQDPKNNDLLNNLLDEALNYPDLVAKTNTEEGLSTQEYNKFKPILDIVKSPVVQSALQNYGPHPKHLSNEQRSDIIDQINKLPYLSDSEKQDFINQVNNTDNTSDALAILNKAKELNQTKKELADIVLAHKHLNDSQKQNFVDQIKHNPYVAKTPNDKPMDQILQEAKELDDKMKELIDEVAKAQQTRNSSIYSNASELAKMDFDEAIVDSLKVINNQTPSGYSTPNLNKEQVQTLIDKLKDLKDKLLDSAIDKLPNLSDKQKEDFKNQIKNSTDDAQKEDIINKAKDLDEKLSELIDKLKELESQKDPLKASEIEKEIDALIEQIKKEHPNFDETPFKDTKNAIKDNKALNDALDKYRNSNVNDDNYLELKNNLQDLVNKVITNINNPHKTLNDLINKVLNSNKELKAQGQSEIDLVDSLLDLLKDKFNDANKVNNELGYFDKYNAFVNELEQKHYFDVLNKIRENNNVAHKDVIALIKSISTDEVSNVIKSAFDKNLENVKESTSSKFIWWWIILTIGSLSLIALMIAAAKKFQKQN